MSIAERPPRSQFLKKLHQLLENPTIPAGLHWTGDNTFEITIEENLAIASLRPHFEFRSLGSFVRQLSYYNFKRLSDRRRSAERGMAKRGFIKFTHSSGYFTRGDPSQITRITRRPRTTRARRPSTAESVASARSDPSEVDQSYGGDQGWAPAPAYGEYPEHSHNGQSSAGPSSSTNYPSFYASPDPVAAREMQLRWRNYQPTVSSTSSSAPRPIVGASSQDESGTMERQRRASTGTTELRPLSSGLVATSQSYPPPSLAEPPSFVALPQINEGRPSLNHARTFTAPVLPTLHQQPLPALPGQFPSWRQQELCGERQLRSNPYPTPTGPQEARIDYFQQSHHYSGEGGGYPSHFEQKTNGQDARPFPENLKAWNSGNGSPPLPSPVGTSSQPGQSPEAHSPPYLEPSQAQLSSSMAAPLSSPHYEYSTQPTSSNGHYDPNSHARQGPNHHMPISFNDGYFATQQQLHQPAPLRPVSNGNLWNSTDA